MDTAPEPPRPLVDPGLVEAARRVLRAADRGGRTVAAPDLYPHQWSWDAAFVAVGWATVSVPRALDELRSLLRGQWAGGMLPHIVFSDAPGYFPGPERWRTAGVPGAPEGASTSGICQPPVHGLAVHLVGEVAAAGSAEDREAFGAFLEETLDAWLAWHRWLEAARRDPETGLLAVHHGWESGMDNSPRWDGPYARVEVGDLAPYERRDLDHVDDPSERPTRAEYDRYLWLVDSLAALGWDDEAARELHVFRVGDVLMTAVHAISAELLADLAAGAGREAVAGELRAMAQSARAAVAASRDPQTGRALDVDLRTRERLTPLTIAGFAPLICGSEPAAYDALVERLLGPRWCGHPALAAPLPPSTSPDDPAFDPASYWRGPTWPVVTWLFSWCLAHHGRPDAAERLRAASLEQLADAVFGEYYHATDGRPLGSDDQSWTAAVVLAWAAGHPRL